MEKNGEINLDAATLENVSQGASRVFNLMRDGIFPSLSILLFVLSVTLLVLWGKKRKSNPLPKEINISNWPLGLRLALIPLLTSFALTHAFSAASVYFNTKIANPGTEAYFQNMGVGRLFSLSHAHLFAHATMYFLLTALVQFSGRGAIFTLWAPLVAIWAGIFDVIAWWGLKEISPNFEILSMVCGTAFSVGFLLMAFAILSSAFCSKK